MDIVTQGLLGGVMAQSVAQRKEKKLATLVGMLAGLLADADVFIQSASDPLLSIEYHRHFTHSLLFIPFGALIAALILFLFLRNKISFPRLYLFSFMGYALSGILDACTSYGTHLLWPFTDERIAWSVISILDPVFSFILLITLIVMLMNGKRQVAIIGMFLATAYLGIGYMQQQRASTEMAKLLQQRNHTPVKLVIKPTLGNILLWRSIYIHNETIYVDAIRPGVFSANKIYQGETAKVLIPEKLSINKASPQFRDIQRFVQFSDGFVAVSPVMENVIGDMRYSMFPTSIRPLWGIVLSPELLEQPVEYKFFRQQSQSERDLFFSMLKGESIQ